MQKSYQQMLAFEEEMKAADVFVFSGRPDTATVVRMAGGEVVTTDGPFAESKEHLTETWCSPDPLGNTTTARRRGLDKLRRETRGMALLREASVLTTPTEGRDEVG